MEMDQTAPLEIETFEHEGRIFYKSQFMDISVIKTNDDFYNATKICQDNDIKDIYEITRYKYWKDNYETVKRICKFDTKTMKITPFHQTVNSRSGDFIEITDDMLMFQIKNQQGDKSILNGVYVRKILVNTILFSVNNEYKVKIGYLMDLIDEELRLRNITLEKKVEEQENVIESLKQNIKEINSGFDHSHTGCIILRHIEDKLYRLSSDTKNRSDSKNWTYCWNGIHNPTDVCSELRYYIKYGCWNDMRFVRYFHGACIEVDDIDLFESHIKEVQEFSVPTPSLRSMIDISKTGFKEITVPLKARLFEIYCYIISGINPFRYGTGERLSLKKNDNGLDLLSIHKKKMGQCKYYDGTTVSRSSITQFLNFCQDFPDFKHYLYISSISKISRELYEIEDIKIKVIDDNKFMKWLAENIGTLDVFTAVNKQLKIDLTPFKQAEEWLINQLKSNIFIKRDDALKYIQSNFDVKIPSVSYFGNLFSHLYKKGNGGRLPLDAEGNKILIDINRNMVEFERVNLLKVMKNGQYTLTDLIQLYGEETGMVFCQNKIVDNHRDILVLNDKGKPFTRRLNRVPSQVYELNESAYPKKYQEIKDFITDMLDKNTGITEIKDKVNEHFHRYESTITMNIMIKNNIQNL